MWCTCVRCGAISNLFFEMYSSEGDARGDVNYEGPERVVKKPQNRGSGAVREGLLNL